MAYVVIIDTLAKATPGADENSGKDMGLALRNAEIIGKALDATVVVIQHVGKDVSKGARGHSSSKATMGTQIEIQYDKSKNERFIHLEKAKDGEDGMRWSFKLQKVVVGEKLKQSGEIKVINSCVINVDPLPIKKLAATQSRAGSFSKMGKWATLIFETLEAITPYGNKVKSSALKDAVVKAGVLKFDVKSRSAEKGFSDGVNELSHKNLVKLHGENVWLVPPDMASEEGPRN